MNKMEEFAKLYCLDTYQHDKEEKKSEWMVSLAFDLCYALWVYRNYYNDSTDEIGRISHILNRVGFSAGYIMETDITEDDTGEFTIAKWIYEDIEAFPERRIQAIEALEYYDTIEED